MTDIRQRAQEWFTKGCYSKHFECEVIISSLLSALEEKEKEAEKYKQRYLWNSPSSYESDKVNHYKELLDKECSRAEQAERERDRYRNALEEKEQELMAYRLDDGPPLPRKLTRSQAKIEHWKSRAEQAERERDRYRDALERIAKPLPDGYDPYYGNKEAEAIAAEALKGGGR